MNSLVHANGGLIHDLREDIVCGLHGEIPFFPISVTNFLY